MPRPEHRGDFGDHPVADLGDDSRLLGNRNEAVRLAHPLARMVPAEKRFGPRDFAGAQTQLRLEREQEFTALDRLGQRGFGIDLELVFARQFLGEQAMLPAATRFGAVHGNVGGAHQRFDAGAVVGADRDADRRADVDAVAMKLERFADCQRDAPRDPLDLGGRADRREEQGELVAGETRDQGSTNFIVGDFGADHDAQPVGDHDQQLVAARMAEAVVDCLEPVEVDEQHRRRGLIGGAASSLAEQLIGLGTEVEAVGQRRDRVVHAERMGILDRRADFGEQAVDRRGDRRHVADDDIGSGADKVAVLHREQAITERRERSGVFAVGAFRGDVADQQAEGAGDDRGDDLLVEFGDIKEGDNREEERRGSGHARQERVADFLRGAFFHDKIAARTPGRARLPFCASKHWGLRKHGRLGGCQPRLRRIR